MKWLILALGIASAGFWLAAARIHIPFGWNTDADRHAAERRVGWLNAAGAICAALTAIASAFTPDLVRIFGG